MLSIAVELSNANVTGEIIYTLKIPTTCYVVDVVRELKTVTVLPCSVNTAKESRRKKHVTGAGFPK